MCCAVLCCAAMPFTSRVEVDGEPREKEKREILQPIQTEKTSKSRSQNENKPVEAVGNGKSDVMCGGLLPLQCLLILI